jgi:hypothetical protein
MFNWLNWFKKRKAASQDEYKQAFQRQAVSNLVQCLIWLAQFDDSSIELKSKNVFASVFDDVDGTRVRQAQGVGHDVVTAVLDLQQVLIDQGWAPNAKAIEAEKSNS